MVEQEPQLRFARNVSVFIGLSRIEKTNRISSAKPAIQPGHQNQARNAVILVKAAQTALDDAMASRDRECRGAVGRYCREREQAVVDRRQALDAAMRVADPQTEAAVKRVAWITHSVVSPSENDFGMLRLALLCLLPRLTGVLIMVGRSK